MFRMAVAFVIGLAFPSIALSQEPISRALVQQWDGAKGNLVASADQMPEADYGFNRWTRVTYFRIKGIVPPSSRPR